MEVVKVSFVHHINDLWPIRLGLCLFHLIVSVLNSMSSPCDKKSKKEATLEKKGTVTGWQWWWKCKNIEVALKSNHEYYTPEGNFNIKHQNSTLLIISHIGHIICVRITTRIFLGTSGFWHSGSLWIVKCFSPAAFNLQSSQFIDWRSFTLSVPTTLALYAFVSGSSFNSLLLGMGLPIWMHFCGSASGSSWRSLKQWWTNVGEWGPILCNKPKAPRSLCLLRVKRFMQRFSW